MDYNETILWRRFMESKGALNNFEYLYLSNRFDKRDINQFLDDVEAEDVILSAFDFTAAGNSIFGFKYWKDMNGEWLRKLEEYRMTGRMEPQTLVKCAHCKRELPKSEFAFTSKGVLHKHCKECESGEFDRKRKEAEKAKKERERQEKEAKRLEKEIFEKETKLNKTTKVCDHCGKRKLKSEFDKSDRTDDGLQSFCKTCQESLKQASEEAEGTTMEERMSAPKLGEYDATLHYNHSKKSITFNSVLSDLVLKGGFTKCCLNTDRSLRQFLIFNKVEGANVVNVHSRASVLVGINSADICRSLAARFNLKLGETSYLHISRNLSRTSSVITIEIIAVRSKEEYVAIVQRREGKKPEQESAPTPKVVEPVAMREEKPTQEPLLDFTDTAMSAEERIRLLVERNLISEQDLAAFLYKRGWKLQEPVRSYKNFTL